MKKEMTEAQKYQRKKNLLIVAFMFLLVVFVAIMCLIVIYAKNNPKEEFLSPDEIEIKQMQMIDYSPAEPDYAIIEDSSAFVVSRDGTNLKLMLTEEGKVVISNKESEELVKIMVNEKDINENIEVIYQTTDESLILTNAGELYKLIDTEIIDGQLNAGQILSNMTVEEIIKLNPNTESVYILNSEDQLVNIDNMKEYNGTIKEIVTSTSTIYIYPNNLFGIEEGKIVTDENNNALKIKISFDNKIIGENDIIYEINTATNTVSTSNLGGFSKIWYKTKEDGTYDITLLSSTGYKDFTSTYYHQ